MECSLNNSDKSKVAGSLGAICWIGIEDVVAGNVGLETETVIQYIETIVEVEVVREVETDCRS